MTLLYVHADNFINDCAYGSIGFNILDMSGECFFMYIYLMNKETQQLLQFTVNIKCNAIRLCR